MKVLDLGCGDRKKVIEGAQVIGIDKIAMPGVDAVHDLNVFPYPFGNNEFDQIICDDVLEHLDDIVAVVEELHRITKPGGEIIISVPHFSSDNYYTDITHKHPFSSRSFDFFDPRFQNNVHQFYSKARFRVEKKYIGFSEVLPSGKKHFPNVWKILGVEYLANRFPRHY
ncbi:MAG TPA: class I SAM-dependent methyltransferase [Candidatus Paceibacterota bacterium]|nr:class I SAM-dependent methyltransferase [Candidatus Paceibacterota bacterium]